jgi:hypothetical protein
MENNLYEENKDYYIIKDYNNKILHIQFSKDKFLKTKYKFRTKKSHDLYWDNLWYNNADEYSIRDFDCNLQKLHLIASYRFLCYNISLIFVSYVFLSFATKVPDFQIYTSIVLTLFFYSGYYILRKYFEYYAEKVFFTKDLLTPTYIRECNEIIKKIKQDDN